MFYQDTQQPLYLFLLLAYPSIQNQVFDWALGSRNNQKSGFDLIWFRLAVEKTAMTTIKKSQIRRDLYL